MNEQEIEQLLKKVEPRKASSGFKQELLRKISHTTPFRKPVDAWFPAFLAAAAALILCVGLWNLDNGKKTAANPSPLPEQAAVSKPIEKPDIFEPTAAQTMLVAYEKEPLRTGARSFNRHRFQLVDCMEWKNKRNGNRFRVVRPRSETVILCDNVY